MSLEPTRHRRPLLAQLGGLLRQAARGYIDIFIGSPKVLPDKVRLYCFVLPLFVTVLHAKVTDELYRPAAGDTPFPWQDLLLVAQWMLSPILPWLAQRRGLSVAWCEAAHAYAYGAVTFALLAIGYLLFVGS